VLWLALFLPELPLQLAQRACKEPHPRVVVDGPATRPVVLCANPQAREMGVRHGMAVASARALVHDLTVLQRNETVEALSLQNLASWAYQFTPAVVVQPTEGLILEIGASLRLHGGLSRLIAALRQGIAELGYRAEPGVAPTPLAAWLFAKARHAGVPVRMCTDAAALPERLSDVPLALLGWPDDVLAPLQTLGVRRIGQCAKLPRDGFIHRFGAARQLDLDRAIGAVADPRVYFVPPDTFASRTEFGFEVSEALALLFPLKRLLQEMEGWLRGRGAGVQQWKLKLEHMNHGRTTLTMGVVAPERNAERFLTLARERLTQTTLMAPVLAIGIAAAQLLPFEESSRSWIAAFVAVVHLVSMSTEPIGQRGVLRAALPRLAIHRAFVHRGELLRVLERNTPPFGAGAQKRNAHMI